MLLDKMLTKQYVLELYIACDSFGQMRPLLFLEYKEVSRESLGLSQLPPKHINYLENIYMLYTSLHCSRILHGSGHAKAWAMTHSPNKFYKDALDHLQRTPRTLNDNTCKKTTSLLPKHPPNK